MTTWLGVWLDNMLTLYDHMKKTLAKARKVLNRVGSLKMKKGLSSEGCKRIEVPAVQVVALYGSQLWWHGQKNKAQEIQVLLNEQGRRVTGCFRTTPQGVLMNDAGLRPAVALLNSWVRCYKLRQMMMPDAQGGGRILELRRNVLQRVEGNNQLIMEDKPFERRSYERTTLPTENSRLKGKVIIKDEKQAMKEAKIEREGLVFWTDGLRKEDEWVGCAVVWEEDGRWKKRRVHLG